MIFGGMYRPVPVIIDLIMVCLRSYTILDSKGKIKPDKEL